MNLLAVDIGNSQITCARFVNGQLANITNSNTADAEQAACYIAKAAAGDIVALCSVVPNVGNLIENHLKSSGCQLIRVATTSQKLLCGVYDSMGADRVANAVAAWKLYCQKSPAVVLDFGTATTLTAVSSQGKFLGGLITLGLGQTMLALSRQAAQLPNVSIHHTSDLTHKYSGGSIPKNGPSLAFSTEKAIVNGALLAHLGTIAAWIKLASDELKAKPITVATGGWSDTLARHTKLFDVVEPYLTLKGIYFIAEAGAGLKDQD
ncbi:MAG: type III pantothenate kinase [Candidatus Melainabacteria bacterium]|nr:type III pantothenate kinase [Candidatus Melainabacteria bacterium]